MAASRSAYRRERRHAGLETYAALGASAKARAITRGKLNLAVLKHQILRQPCEVCGATESVEAHHEDYTKPLDVQWLCPTHHQARERAKRKGHTMTALAAAPPRTEDLATQRAVLALFLTGEERQATAEIKTRLPDIDPGAIEGALVELVFAGILGHDRGHALYLRPCVAHLGRLGPGLLPPVGGSTLDASESGSVAEILTQWMEGREDSLLRTRIEEIRDRLRKNTANGVST